MAKYTPTATYDDANLILRLYDMRREERMREARAWFTANFHVSSMEEMQKLCPAGSKENAYYRQVVSYWDMAASFVTSGVLSEDLFFESNRELLLVYTRIEKLLPEVRKTNQDPFAMKNLETVAASCIAWMNKRAPGSYESFASRMSKVR
jgi:Lon protease-like protein